MDKFHIELNEQGVRELLRSQEMAAICQGLAQGIAGRAGGGYEVDTYTGRNRVNARVSCATEKAAKDNLENNTLLKAVTG